LRVLMHENGTSPIWVAILRTKTSARRKIKKHRSIFIG
jgi:hypothetical protein